MGLGPCRHEHLWSQGQVRPRAVSKRGPENAPWTMIDNATIKAYNSDSKHRIRKILMSDTAVKPTNTLDPLAAGKAGDTVLDSAPAVAPGRLDSPIERTDLGTPDTFIPESVDQ